MSKKDNAAHFRAIRKELAEELGYDPDKLTAVQSMRVDVVFGLKSTLDEMRARMFDGEKVDTNEMRQIADTLEKYLPRHADPDPTPAIFKRDPHVVMQEIIDRWIKADEQDRAEKGLSPRIHDPEEQQARIDALEAENAELRGMLPADDPTRALPSPERPIDVPTSAITPPSEQSDRARNLYRGAPRNGPDNPKPPVVIEGTKLPPGARL